MSSLSPLGTRQYQNTALAGSTQQPARGNNALQQPAATGASSNVALSSGAVDLQGRLDALGNGTIDLAQNFLGKFAQQLLGDGAKGATIDFDSVALETSSSMAFGAQRAEGSNGVTHAAAFSLDESSHFLGKGTITLADGTKYDFEVEVQYASSMSAGYTSPEAAEREKLAGQNPAMPLPAIEFPDIDWPGSLGDLFKLMDKPVSGDVKNADNGDLLGNLSVRLMQLVKNTQSLDTYAPPSPAKAYLADQKPDRAAAAGLTNDKADAAGGAQMPIKVPVEPAAGGPADVPLVKTADDIRPTISTTPAPADDA